MSLAGINYYLYLLLSVVDPRCRHPSPKIENYGGITHRVLNKLTRQLFNLVTSKPRHTAPNLSSLNLKLLDVVYISLQLSDSYFTSSIPTLHTAPNH
jgi:hypothetical protein